MPETEAGGVEFDVDVREDRTIITVTGQRDGAVVVRSDSGERIYLPPENAVGGAAADDSVYQRASDDSSYQQAEDDDSVYQRASDEGDQSVGRQSIAGGIRIIHPEPADDVRFLR